VLTWSKPFDQKLVEQVQDLIFKKFNTMKYDENLYPKHRPTRSILGSNKMMNWVVKQNHDNLSKDENGYPQWTKKENWIFVIQVDKHIQDGYGDQVANIWFSQN
jgi:hypothetical protein